MNRRYSLRGFPVSLPGWMLSQSVSERAVSTGGMTGPRAQPGG